MRQADIILSLLRDGPKTLRQVAAHPSGVFYEFRSRVSELRAVGYVITRGDKFSWDQGSSPVRRCLHEFSDSVTADSNGRTAPTSVFPAIRAGATTGLTVSLSRPAAEMMIVPGSYDFPSTGAVMSSISFTAIQIP